MIATGTELHIVIIDESPVRAAILEDGLREAGYTRVTLVSEMTQLARRVYALDPDVILIDLENPSRDVLEQMFQVSRAVKRPVAMFVDQSDATMIQASVDAGVSAYIVDGLKKERVRPILDLTISRFNAFTSLERELDEARSALAERKTIERAKGILMRQKKLTEEEAYAMLRSAAMKHGRKLAEVAAAGMAPATPVVAVASVSRPDEVRWRGALSTLADDRLPFDGSPPILLGIGAVFAGGRTAEADTGACGR